MIKIVRYSDDFKNMWDEFNDSSKTALFMFNRNYMDYHRDRFVDHSLLFFRDDKLIALLPMTERDNKLISHGGLTYGGFISNYNMKQHIMNECFDALIEYAKENSFSNIYYKCVPYIFYNMPSEEDRYSLFMNGGKMASIDVSTYLKLDMSIKMSKGRKAQISRAKREGVEIDIFSEGKYYDEFIDLENEVLQKKHNTTAVHSGKELKLLHDYFPNRIHLYGAQKRDKLIAGTVIYEYENVIHTQYMAANEEARTIGALDLTIATVISDYCGKKKYLDFGISTERDTFFLNEGLCAQKESFGGRTGIYESWVINI